MNLVEALAPDGGVVCAVGAGGKKSTLYALADRLEHAVVTATVRIPIFDPHVADVQVTEDPVAAATQADSGDWPLGLIRAREQGRDDRYLGYDPETVDALARADVAETVLVKADGARMREFKAPGANEPQLPQTAAVVLPVASVHAVGEPLDENVVHRPERVAAITDRAVGDTIRPRDVADVLASPAGGRQDVPADATVRPVLNKVDDAALERTARTIADDLVDRQGIADVVLARMTAADPLVDVVT